ncbi:MAG: 3-deoxy-D-manno-octulosonic acid transferase [Planctomycetes bacterium]|nr:3-deoxy-D-manno-octulosonic acid transferase [Planctomycetota bacterium]
MKSLLKSIVCDVYYLLFFVLSFPVWGFRALTRASWREGALQRMGFVSVPAPSKPRIWIHGVSVGEILAARGLIRALSQDPRFEVALSTTTRTGFEVAGRTFPGLPLFHYPLDLSGFVRRTMDRVRPSLVIMIELEVWPNFLLAAGRRGVPVAFVNGRITRRSWESYRYLGWILRPVFGGIPLFCVQNDEYASRLLHLGAPGDRIRITGNVKYDNLPAAPDPAETARLREELGLAGGDTVLLGGSVHPGEDEALVAAFRALSPSRPGLRLVLVPRHPERFDQAEAVVRGAGLPCHRRTAGRAEAGARPVWLIDTMGELGRLYAAADVVFVGGSLVPRGGQNMMEPAALGKPVLFGPSVHNFKEDAALLLEAGAALQVPGPEALAPAVEGLLADPARARALGEAAARAVASRRGATRRTIEALESSVLSALAAPPAAGK